MSTPKLRAVLSPFACTLLCGFASCSVYEAVSFRDKGPNRSMVHGATSAKGSAGSLDGGPSRIETERIRDASPPDLNAGQGGLESDRARDGGRVAMLDASVGDQPDGPRGGNGSSPADADVGDAAVDSSDGGNATQIDTGVDQQIADPDAGTGFCSACDSQPASNPVLKESGGTGNVTAYGSVMSPAPSGGGACNYGPTAIKYFAAINVNAQDGDANGQWQGGRICGQCAAVRVKTPEGWKETVVRIVDKCSDAQCGIALGGAPAKDLMGGRPGRYEGSWRFVSCEGHPEVSDGPPAIHIKDGSSTWWALTHVRNPIQAVTAIDWQSADGAGSGSFAYATEAENFFSVPQVVHDSGSVRLTIHYRDTTTVAIELAANQLAQPEANIFLP